MTFISSTGMRCEFVVLRTPLLPFSTIPDLVEPEQAHCTELASTVSHRRLREVVSLPAVREALYLASPELAAAANRWLADPSSEDRRLSQTLTRYICRMAGRATPFGLFAGISVLPIGAKSAFTVGGRETCRRKLSVDNGLLTALCGRLQRRVDLRTGLRYRPNSSVHSLAGRLRYVRLDPLGRWQRHVYAAVDDSTELQVVLGCAGSGASFPDLTRALLTHDSTLEADDVDAFVHRLIDEQLLVPSICVPTTGVPPLNAVVEQLHNLEGATHEATVLTHVLTRLDEMNGLPLGMDVSLYESLATQLRSLQDYPTTEGLFQADMVREATGAACGQTIVEAVSQAAVLLHAIHDEASDNLDAFCDAFIERYERMEVPLLEVLDPESGLGFGLSLPEADPSNAPLAAWLPTRPDLQTPQAPANAARDLMLVRGVAEAVRSNKIEWALAATDVEALATRTKPALPDAFLVSCALIGKIQNDGLPEKLFIRSINGPSGIKPLGRFCHADDRLHRYVLNHIRQEEALRPQAAFAELVHVPEGRQNNISARPVLRQYEIPYLGFSAAPESDQIAAADLLVSVRDRRVVLRSMRLGIEVLPRLSTAHNVVHGLPVYKFLAAVQNQGLPSFIGWSWGRLNSLPFLPRVTHGRLVLSRARWLMAEADRQRILRPKVSRERCLALKNWCITEKLPRLLLLANRDQELPIDVENDLCLESCVRLMRRSGACVFIEMLCSTTDLTVESSEGPLVNEVMVPFVRQAADPKNNAQMVPLRKSAATRTIKRSFTPGSEWSYSKWYTGRAGADALLRYEVSNVLQRAPREQQWFFVRYGDPDWHVRLRWFHRTDADQMLTVRLIEREASRAMEQKRIWRMQFDSYQREVERYGGPVGIVVAERLFYHDSVAALQLLRALSDSEPDMRWRACILSWDRWLDDLGFDVTMKHEFVRRSADALWHRLGRTRALWLSVDGRFRSERAFFDQVRDAQPWNGHPMEPVRRVMHDRSTAVAESIGALRRGMLRGEIEEAADRYASSFLHMSANRMLRAPSSGQEYVMYGLLTKLYASQLARHRARTKAR